jgi:hypothetical protein
MMLMDDKSMSFNDEDEILPEYDFSRTQSNKHASRSAPVRKGATFTPSRVSDNGSWPSLANRAILKDHERSACRV